MPLASAKRLSKATSKQTSFVVKTSRSRRGVARSAELIRVRDLARRSLEQYDENVALALSIEMRRPGSKFVFKVQQAAMLLEAAEVFGLFSTSAVGGGKTTIAPLFGRVMGAKRAVLIIPPSLKAEVVGRVIPRLCREFDFTPPTVLTYSDLSSAKSTDLLERLQPDLIIADEAHNLKNKNAARTKRFERYMKAHPDCSLVLMSGTMMRKSLRDFAHLLQLSHRGGSAPITRQWKELEEWAAALDPNVHPSERLAPGALMEFARPGESAREGYARRLLDTPGVVGGGREDIGCSLIFRERKVAVPAVVQDALAQLRSAWALPSGEEVVDPLDFYRKARELAQGFYYVWRWPHGEPDDEDRAWLAARSAWRRAVSAVTRLNRTGLDSELLVRNACERVHDGKETDLPKHSLKELVSVWLNWEKYREREEPPVEPVWLSDFLVRAACAWLDEVGDGVAWYDSRAVGALAAKLSRRVHAAGNRGNDSMLADASVPAGKPIAAFASATAHGTGKNLQRWNNALWMTPTSSGGTAEQLAGRHHRPGVELFHDEVVIDFFAHTEELRAGLRTAVSQSRFLQDTQQTPQKMLTATWLGFDPRAGEDE